jgi:hypothetical protein
VVRQSLIILLLCLPSPLFAQTICGQQDYDGESEPDFECPSPGEDALTPDLHPPSSIPAPLGALTESPWDGVLVHRDRLVEVGMRLKALRRLRWADRLRLAERYHLELSHLRDTQRIREELLAAQEAAQRTRAEVAERRATSARAWYRSWGFGFLMGFLASGALVVLAVYLGVAL